MKTAIRSPNYFDGKQLGRIFFALFVMIGFAACQATPTLKESGGGNILQTYKLESIDVGYSSKTAKYQGISEAFSLRASNESSKEAAERANAVLEQVLKQKVPPYFKGERPAKMVVEILMTSVASDLGYISGQSTSSMTGIVSIYDATTGDRLASQEIRGSEGTTNITVSGIPTSRIISAIQKGPDQDRVVILANNFADNTIRWLQ